MSIYVLKALLITLESKFTKYVIWVDCFECFKWNCRIVINDIMLSYGIIAFYWDFFHLGSCGISNIVKSRTTEYPILVELTEEEKSKCQNPRIENRRRILYQTDP